MHANGSRLPSRKAHPAFRRPSARAPVTRNRATSPPAPLTSPRPRSTPAEADALPTPVHPLRWLRPVCCTSAAAPRPRRDFPLPFRGLGQTGTRLENPRVGGAIPSLGPPLPTARRTLLFDFAEATLVLSSESPLIRTKTTSRRTNAVRIAIRWLSLPMVARNAITSASDLSKLTTSATPRRIQVRRVKSGIDNSEKRSGFPVSTMACFRR